jgi:hypothetical protein
VPHSRASRRRRLQLFVASFLVVSAFSAFVSDVRTAAHHSSGPLSNVNKNFAGLANNLLRSQNVLDGEFQFLLSQGSSMTRVEVASRLSVMSSEANSLLIASAHLVNPVIVNDINLKLETVTDHRAGAWLTLIHDLEVKLQLPVTAKVSVPNPESTLHSAHVAWAKLRYSLANQPGHVHLIGTTNKTFDYLRSTGFSNLTHSSALRLVRNVSISAVQVNPAPLPRVGQTLVVPATGLIHIGVVVSNGAYTEQPVNLRITLTDLSGRNGVQTVLMHAVLAPSGSYAFVPRDFRVSSNERATLSMVLVNAPHLPGVATGRNYQVLTTPAG